MQTKCHDYNLFWYKKGQQMRIYITFILLTASRNALFAHALLNVKKCNNRFESPINVFQTHVMRSNRPTIQQSQNYRLRDDGTH